MLKFQTVFFIAILTAGLVAQAQGDYAPFESPKKLKKIVAPSKKSAAVPAVKKKPKDPGQNAIVTVDGSAIYEAPNFDSPVVEYLDVSKKVKISKKLYPGVGGLGAFYKIRLRQGVFGFITDTDVKLESREGREKVAEEKKEEQQDMAGDPSQLQPEMQKDTDEEEGAAPVADSFYLARYFGLSYNNFNYTERDGGKTLNAPTALFGLKRTGPTSFVGGVPLELNFMFTTQAPSFYDKFDSSTSGFMLIGDALINLTLTEGKTYYVFWGFGPLVRYSKWNAKLKLFPSKAAIDSQEVAFGLAADLGLAIRMGKRLAFRLDGKYYYEKQKYFGYGAALEFKY